MYNSPTQVASPTGVTIISQVPRTNVAPAPHMENHFGPAPPGYQQSNFQGPVQSYGAPVTGGNTGFQSNYSQVQQQYQPYIVTSQNKFS